MPGTITVRYIQEYLKKKDYNKAARTDYMLKLVEEVGELSRALYKWDGQSHPEADGVKGTLEEELCDVLYYTLALANVCDIDVETWFPRKEELNAKKWNQPIPFDPLGAEEEK